MSERSFLEAVFGNCFGDVITVPSFTDAIDAAISALDNREAMILRERFGLKTPQLTLKQVAEHLPRIGGGVGVLPERVRQIEKRALRRIRHPSRLGHLKEQVEQLLSETDEYGGRVAQVSPYTTRTTYPRRELPDLE